METLDQSNSNQISERAIRNLSSSSVWIIIASAVGIFTALYFLYVAAMLMSSPYASQQGGVMLIFSLIFAVMHVLGLLYGISLTKLKIFNADDFDKASIKHNTYWIYVGIVYIIWFLLMLLGLAGGAGRYF